MATDETKPVFYALHESLWMDQRLEAQNRFGSWRRYPLFKMDGDGESAKIVEPIENPSPEEIRQAREWGQIFR